MAETPKPSEVPIGSVLPGGVVIIPNVVPESPAGKFRVVIPGRTYRSGPVVVSRVVPRARMTLGPVDTTVMRAARISAEVLDMERLCAGAETVMDALETRTPLSFAVAFQAHDLSYKDVMKGAEMAQTDYCCDECGSRTAEFAFTGAVQIGMAPGAEGKLKWTWGALARIYARVDGSLPFGYQDDLADCVAVKDNCTDNWEWPECETFCEGHQCTDPEVCHCGVNANKVPQVRCDGFVRCNCNVV